MQMQSYNLIGNVQSTPELLASWGRYQHFLFIQQILRIQSTI